MVPTLKKLIIKIGRAIWSGAIAQAFAHEQTNKQTNKQKKKQKSAKKFSSQKKIGKKVKRMSSLASLTHPISDLDELGKRSALWDE